MYQSFIGLEVHIRLLSANKVFCGCRSAYGDEPNTNICPICMGYPGALPVLNIEAMRMGCMAARALNCRIPDKTWFDRKQYFYPDMPKNYQITQYASPLGQGGYFDIPEMGRRIRIKECHLEEDAGKMIHTGSVSLLDYNRAGVALLEMVTEPDMHSGEEAELFIQQLRRMVRYLGVCDGNMEEGSLRADANVSINVPGKGPGKKVEIKNLNSSRHVRLALNYEIVRQGELLDTGKTVTQDTRLWNEARGETVPMRSKEDAHDYRYFTEPDLPAFILNAAFLASVDAAMTELPLPRVQRFTAEYGLSREQADLLCEEKAQADYFESAVAETLKGTIKLAKTEAAARVANWLLQDIKHIMSKENIPLCEITSFRLNPQRLASLACMAAAGKLSSKNARQTLELVVEEDRDPELIVQEKGWELISDPAQIAEWVQQIAQTETKALAQAKAAFAGNEDKRLQTLIAYLTGKVIAASGGRADPKIVREQVEKAYHKADSAALLGGGT